MKKIFATIIVFALFISIFAGCKQENSANLIAKDLDTNLNKLEVAVTKLDTVENKYLANPDIYSSLSASQNPNQGKYFALAFNNDVSTSTTDIVKQALIDKITDKLLQGNSSYNTNDSITCKKYCDTNGNCYYTDCNGNNYCYGSNGSYYECGAIPSTCSYMGETTLQSETLATNNNNNLVATRLAVENNSADEEVNSETINTSDTLESNNSTTTNNTTEESNETNNSTNLEENTDTTINTPNPRVKVFYFSQDSFAPVKLKYNPRFISQYNESTINEQIESYLSKVQKLYAMSEDSIEANTTLANCKQNILDCVREIKELNDCIINGNCEPNVEQLQALNNYIIDIKTTTKRLKDCNGELSKEVSKIGQSNTNAMINSVDVMSSNYMRLINHIDTRVTYHKSAIATLEQIKYLLDNAVNNNEITDEEIEELIEDFTIQSDDEDIDNNINNSNSTEIKDDNMQDLNDNNSVVTEDNSIVYDNYLYNDDTNATESTTSSNIENNTQNEEIINEEITITNSDNNNDETTDNTDSNNNQTTIQESTDTEITTETNTNNDSVLVKENDTTTTVVENNETLNIENSDDTNETVVKNEEDTNSENQDKEITNENSQNEIVVEETNDDSTVNNETQKKNY